MNQSAHTFHIPVMGLAFTIDTPVKVARFGISSVMSIIEDNLVEKMRSYYYNLRGEHYSPISSNETDYRAKRITDYLNLVQHIVAEQLEHLRQEPFSPGSEIVKYFEMLPPQHPLQTVFEEMMQCCDEEKKEKLAIWLRKQIVPGTIDVNIMTKLDKVNTDKEGKVIVDGSDAVAALRGYAQSNLTNSSVVLSAGLNPRLFNYMESLSSFDRHEDGTFDKKIIIKVSDYRSAYIQGKMLAKKGLWVSEFRIESGLNCGGHAFATDGILIGPILEEFKNKRLSLADELFKLYDQALTEKRKSRLPIPPPLSISVQGGIGTAEEDDFLKSYYGVTSTGWGTPFLLVPEATTVDDATLQLLSKATEEDVYMSKNSPLGVRFHYLKGTSGEQEKFDRIKRGRPGSPCTEKYLVSNTEFTTEPICTASRAYQEKKLEQLKSLSLPVEQYQKQVKEVLDKECLCIGLSNSAVKKNNLKPFKKLEAVTICPGPNIAYFSKVVSLRDMVDHIYGRLNVLTHPNRPAMFVKELSLYVDYLREMIDQTVETFDEKAQKQIQNFSKNISEGIAYYKNLITKIEEERAGLMHHIREGLKEIENKFLEESALKLENTVG
ncbi:MAG: hypothetical protein JST43_06625 [Bacteroidetes bacterium]|nr:hypothetical protein [Bacteroidota bacterium]MBS1539635.1 hypothetical protein [Bacteroidota bacterium]